MEPRIEQECVICKQSLSNHKSSCPAKKVEDLCAQRMYGVCPKCGKHEVDANKDDFLECVACGIQYTRSPIAPGEDPDTLEKAYVLFETEFAGGLGVVWTPLSPGLLSLAGSASYYDHSTAHFQVKEDIQNLSYQGTIAVSPGPLQLSFSATRAQTDYSLKGETTQAGTIRTDSYTDVASFSTAALPQVRAVWFQSDQASFFTGAPESRASVDSLGVNVYHNVPTHAFALGYRTSCASGTRAQANYQTHALNLNVEATQTFNPKPPQLRSSA